MGFCAVNPGNQSWPSLTRRAKLFFLMLPLDCSAQILKQPHCLSSQKCETLCEGWGREEAP